MARFASGAALVLLVQFLAAHADVVASEVVVASATSWSGAMSFPGSTLVVAAPITFSGTLVVSAQNIIILNTGSFVGLGGGSGADSGSCWATHTGAWAYHGGGGAHAGCAAYKDDACPGPQYTLYGDAFYPTTPGSGGTTATNGCGGTGGAGGGAIILNATNTLVVNGTIIADGAAGGNGNGGCWEAGGGGSGGSALLIAGTLGYSVGSVSANGGMGAFPSASGPGNSAGGGGGRVAVLCSAHSFASSDWSDWMLNMTTYGGSYAGCCGYSGSGTVYVNCGTRASSLLIAGPPPTPSCSDIGVISSLILPASTSLSEVVITRSGNVSVSTASGLPVTLAVTTNIGDGTGMLVPGPAVTLVIAAQVPVPTATSHTSPQTHTSSRTASLSKTHTRTSTRTESHTSTSTPSGTPSWTPRPSRVHDLCGHGGPCSPSSSHNVNAPSSSTKPKQSSNNRA